MLDFYSNILEENLRGHFLCVGPTIRKGGNNRLSLPEVSSSSLPTHPGAPHPDPHPPRRCRTPGWRSVGRGCPPTAKGPWAGPSPGTGCHLYEDECSGSAVWGFDPGTQGLMWVERGSQGWEDKDVGRVPASTPTSVGYE